MRARQPGSRGIDRIATRLLLAALVPIVGLSVFASTVSRSHYDEAEVAGEVAAAADRLVSIGELAVHVGFERTLANGRLQASDGLGLDVTVLSAGTGNGFDFSIARERDLVDGEVGHLRLDRTDEDASIEERRVRELVRQLAGYRERLDNGSATASDQRRYFNELLSSIATWNRTELDRVDRLAEGASLGDTRAAIATYQNVIDIVRSADELSAGLAEALVVGLTDGVPSESRAEITRALVEGDLAEGRLVANGTDVVLSAWLSMAAMSAIEEFGSTRRDLIEPIAYGELVELNSDVLSTVIDEYAVIFARIDLMSDLLTVASDEIRSAAAAEQAAAERTFDLILVLSIGTFALTVVLVFFLSRSIQSPLARLARHAETVSAGGRPSAPLAERGPREIAIAAAAINDFTASLGKLEEQAGALAAGRLDDPVLSEAVEGPIGESLQASVEHLSEAWGQLQHEANHDNLTGLPNRAAARRALREALENAGDASSVSVMFVDLDRFKAVNDTYGHQVGDELLRAVGLRLRGALDPVHLLARLGGDEFVVVLSDVQAAPGALLVAERLLAQFDRPFVIGHRTMALDLSVGIAIGEAGADTADDLLRDAGLAVRRAKGHRGSRAEICDDELRAEAAVRRDIERELPAALDAGDLFVHLQPIVTAANGEVRAAELLLRWDRPGGPGVGPADFIPIAEELGLIVPIGRYVLRHACEVLARWATECPERRVELAVNISALHLIEGDLVGDLHDVLESTGVDPSLLAVEITESHAIGDIERVIDRLEEVRAVGVRISLDDFGTGYSSLAHLQALPVDQLKIDRTFVSTFGAGEGDSREVVELILALGRLLELEVVAEGVETEDQLLRLQAAGCELVQGFLIARPMPLAAFEEWLSTATVPWAATRVTT